LDRVLAEFIAGPTTFISISLELQLWLLIVHCLHAARIIKTTNSASKYISTHTHTHMVCDMYVISYSFMHIWLWTLMVTMAN